MLIVQILLSVVIVPVVIYRLGNAYWKRSLSLWLKNISVQYGIKAEQYDYFHRKVIAYDKKRAVLVFLDEDSKEHGHIIGIKEITNCELIVHETNDDGKQHNIDGIDLELQLKTGNKTVALHLYEKSFFASLNKKKLQLRAVEWYEMIAAVTKVNAEAVSQTA